MARKYDFYFRVVKTIFYERAQRVSKILFSTRENKSHISKATVKCSFYYMAKINFIKMFCSSPYANNAMSLRSFIEAK